MTAMLDHAGMIEAGEKTIADRDAEIETLKHKAQGLHRVADKLAVTVEGLEAELADVRMKHEASRKRASDLEAKRVATVNGLQVEFTGQMSQLEKMLPQASRRQSAPLCARPGSGDGGHQGPELAPGHRVRRR